MAFLTAFNLLIMENARANVHIFFHDYQIIYKDKHMTNTNPF